MSKVYPIYAVVGTDVFLQLEALAQIRAQLPREAQRIDFEGERAELAEVFDELRSFAMFGGDSKLVVVRDADEFISRFREQLEDYCDAPSTSATLVLRTPALASRERIHKAISKVGRIIACDPPAQLKPWIIERAKSTHKIAVEPQAAELLAELIGADLGRIDNELAKLALQTQGAKVSATDVSSSVAFQREQEIKEMTIELAVGNPREALRRWQKLTQLDNSAEFRAVTWFTMWLEDVGFILDGGSTQKIFWKYKPRLDEFMRFAKLLGRDGYSRAVARLAETDRRSKSGLGDAVTNVERFILSFAGD